MSQELELENIDAVKSGPKLISSKRKSKFELIRMHLKISKGEIRCP